MRIKWANIWKHLIWNALSRNLVFIVSNVQDTNFTLKQTNLEGKRQRKTTGTDTFTENRCLNPQPPPPQYTKPTGQIPVGFLPHNRNPSLLLKWRTGPGLCFSSTLWLPLAFDPCRFTPWSLSPEGRYFRGCLSSRALWLRISTGSLEARLCPLSILTDSSPLLGDFMGRLLRPICGLVQPSVLVTVLNRYLCLCFQEVTGWGAGLALDQILLLKLVIH